MTAQIWDSSEGAPVIAFGGNALLPDASDPKASERNAAAFAGAVLRLTPPGAGVVLVHGNGPQVGSALLRSEAGAGEVPPAPLDELVADTQGSIGYLLGRALRNAVGGGDRNLEVATVVTQMVVDPEDPAMRQPTKPVGPFYPPDTGAALARDRGWTMVDVPGRGVRRVVPSPPPLEIVEIEAIRALADAGHAVVAGGGGGIPVARSGRHLVGVEGVIDKDRTASLIARTLRAPGLVILTEVGHASKAFGTKNEMPLLELSVDEARRLHAEGEFPPGSMGPKIEAAIEYAEAMHRTALITSVGALDDALAGSDGTRIQPA